MPRAKRHQRKIYTVGDSKDAIQSLANLIRGRIELSLEDVQTRILAASIISGTYDIVNDPRTNQSVAAVQYHGRYYPVAPYGEFPMPCAQRDRECEIERIWAFNSLNVRYTWDMDGSDMYQDLRTSLESGTGDCDDMTTVFCALLRAVGFECGARIISLDGSSWDHIYPLVEIPDLGWVPLDATEPDKDAGWEYAKPAEYIDFYMGEGD